MANATFPNTLETIGEGAFKECSLLSSVDVPEGTKKIGKEAFYMCESIKNVSFPDSLKSIGESAFCGCGELVRIILPKGLKEIGEGSFALCCKAKKLSIPKTLKTIEDYSFTGCKNLKSVSIPEGVLGIDEGAFSGCKKMQKVNLPLSLGYIDTGYGETKAGYITTGKYVGVADPFGDCPKLKKMIYAGSKSSFKKVEYKLPGGVKLTCKYKPVKIKSVKCLKNGKVLLKWKKSPGVAGYVVSYSDEFHSSIKKTIKSKSKTRIKLKGMWVKNKKYTIKIRSYKKSGKYKVYSDWKTKKVRITSW